MIERKSNMEITHATILLTEGADIVMLRTDLPSPMPKISDQNLMLKFGVEYNCGKKYVIDNFHINPEVIDNRGKSIISS